MTNASGAGAGEPSLDVVGDGIWLLRSPMPVVNPHEVLTYLIEDASGNLHVVDPGWSSEDAWLALEQALGTLGRSIAQIASVTATHVHIDHFGLAARVRNASGAAIRLGAADIEIGRSPWSSADMDRALDAWGVPEGRRAELRASGRGHPPQEEFPEVDALVDGAMLPIPGRHVRALATPGHTPGHTALVVEYARVVLLGDHLLPESFPGIGLGGAEDPAPIEHYLRSLARVVELGDVVGCPGHERVFDRVAERAVETAEHHLRRTREIAEILADARDLSIWEVARRVTWSQGFDGLAGLRLRSALAQVGMHAEFAETAVGRRAVASGFAAFASL